MAGFSWPGDLGIFKDIADKFFSDADASELRPIAGERDGFGGSVSAAPMSAELRGSLANRLSRMSIQRLPKNHVGADAMESAPKKLGRVGALPLAVLALFGASACTREVVVKETPAPSAAGSASASSAPTTAAPSVTVSPVSDRSKLCSRALGRVREIGVASKKYWDLVHKSGFGDPAVNDAGDDLRQTVIKVLPLLKGLVGAESPQDVAAAIKTFADAVDRFSEAAGAHSSEDEINPLASEYGHALDGINQLCEKG